MAKLNGIYSGQDKSGLSKSIMKAQSHFKRSIFAVSLLLIGFLFPAESIAQYGIADAQQKALLYNKDLQVKKLGIKQAESELLNARLLTPFNPELEMERDSDFLTSRSGEGSFQVSLSQEFEIGNQRGQRKGIATARLELARINALAFQEILLSDVRYSYSALLAAQRGVANAKFAESLARSLRDTAYVRFRNGFIPFSEYTFLNLDYISMVKTRSDTEVELNETGNQMALLLGLGDNDSISAAGDLSIVPLTLTEEQIISMALKSRYEILENKLNRKISNSEFALARRQNIPNLRLSAFYLRDKGIFTSDNLTGSVPGFEKLSDTDNLFGLRIAIPLPVINRHRSEMTGFKIQTDIIDTLMQILEQRIKSEVKTSYLNLRKAEDNFRLFEDALPDADSIFGLLQIAYSEGRIRLDDYLFQKDRLLSVRQQYIEAYLEYSGAIRAVERAVGLERGSIR
jgi:outer membrane protein TolC